MNRYLYLQIDGAGVRIYVYKIVEENPQYYMCKQVGFMYPLHSEKWNNLSTRLNKELLLLNLYKIYILSSNETMEDLYTHF